MKNKRLQKKDRNPKYTVLLLFMDISREPAGNNRKQIE